MSKSASYATRSPVRPAADGPSDSDENASMSPVGAPLEAGSSRPHGAQSKEFTVSATKMRKPLRRTRGKPNFVDRHVGARMRQRRILLGMSQERLGAALDLTFQQVQKYERGTNRLGAGRLHAVAEALGVPVTYFFEEMPEEVRPTGAPEAETSEDPMSKRETLTMVRAYYSIPDPAVRTRLLDLIKSLHRD